MRLRTSLGWRTQMTRVWAKSCKRGVIEVIETTCPFRRGVWVLG